MRPASPTVTYTVGGDGAISVSDERWYELVVMEERAAREEKRAELRDRAVSDSDSDSDADPDEMVKPPSYAPGTGPADPLKDLSIKPQDSSQGPQDGAGEGEQRPPSEGPEGPTKPPDASQPPADSEGEASNGGIDLRLRR